MEHVVFISYATEDAATAMVLCDALERQGSRCWIAPRDVTPGVPYAEAIVLAIRTCRVFVVVFSAHSNTSPQVAREVERAGARGVPILPFRIADVAMTPTMEFFLSGPHWLDATRATLAEASSRLATTVRSLLGGPVGGLGAPELSTEAEPPKPPFRVPTSGRYDDPEFSPFYQIRITAGPHVGTVCLLSSVRVDAGRSADCPIRLGNEPGISKFHFSICWDDEVGRFVLLAPNSKVGVSVNGAHTVSAVLVTGDQITAGSTAMVFEMASSQYDRQDD